MCIDFLDVSSVVLKSTYKSRSREDYPNKLQKI